MLSALALAAATAVPPPTDGAAALVAPREMQAEANWWRKHHHGGSKKEEAPPRLVYGDHPGKAQREERRHKREEKREVHTTFRPAHFRRKHDVSKHVHVAHTASSAPSQLGLEPPDDSSLSLLLCLLLTRVRASCRDRAPRRDGGAARAKHEAACRRRGGSPRGQSGASRRTQGGGEGGAEGGAEGEGEGGGREADERRQAG